MTDHAKAVREAREVLVYGGLMDFKSIRSDRKALDRFEAAIRAQERAEAHVAGCYCTAWPPYADRTDPRCQARRDGQ